MSLAVGVYLLTLLFCFLLGGVVVPLIEFSLERRELIRWIKKSKPGDGVPPRIRRIARQNFVSAKKVL